MSADWIIDSFGCAIDSVGCIVSSMGSVTDSLFDFLFMLI